MIGPEIIDPQKVTPLLNSGEKNQHACQIISRYAARHAAMDVIVGLFGLIPGAGIAAIATSLAAQGPIIYKPMAAELAGLYMSSVDDYVIDVINIAAPATVAIEFAQEFGVEFLGEIAQELLMELGWGAMATFVPFVGAVVAGTLDYLIANMMTWRVGTMTSLYFQNGGEWVNNRKATFEIAKTLTGPFHYPISSIVSGSAKEEKPVRVDLDSIPRKVAHVKNSGVANVMPMVKSLIKVMSPEQALRALKNMGIPSIVAEAAVARAA